MGDRRLGTTAPEDHILKLYSEDKITLIGLQRTIDRPFLVENMYTLNHLILSAATPVCQVGQCPDKIDLCEVVSLALYQA